MKLQYTKKISQFCKTHLKRLRHLGILAGIIWLLHGCALSTGKEFSADDIYSIVKREDFSDKYTRADAVILLSQKRIIVKADASIETTIHYVIKINSNAAIKQFGDLKFGYNENTETVNILTARTIKRDGSTVPVEKKAINSLTHPVASQAPAYVHHKQKVVSFPALETGSVIEIKLKKFTRNQVELKNLRLAGSEVFQSTIPIRYKELVIQAPENFTFYYKYHNGLPKPVIIKNKDHQTYVWHARHVRSILLEPHMPRFAAFAPALSYTTKSSWEESSQWLRDRIFDKIDAGPETTAAVNQLTKGLAEEIELIRAIYRFVVDKIKDVNVPFELVDFEPKSIRTTLANHNGNSLDKSLLLISMLKSVNINAYPVLASTRVLEPDVLTSLNLFTRMYVQVNRQGKAPLILNPMSHACSFDQGPAIRDFSALVIRPNDSLFIPRVSIPLGANRLQTELSFVLDDRGNVSGSLAFEYEGYYDCYIRKIRNRSAEQIEPMLIAISKIFGEGTIVENYSISNLNDRDLDAKLTLDITSPELGVVQGDLMILRLPPIIPRYLFLNAALDRRRHDLLPEFQPIIDVRGSIKLPQNFTVFRMPSSSVIKHKSDQISISYDYIAKTKTILFNFKLVILSNPITKEEYPAFKAMIDDFRSQKNRLILLKKSSTF